MKWICVRCGTGEEDDCGLRGIPQETAFFRQRLSVAIQRKQHHCLPGLDTGGWLCAELTFILQLIFTMFKSFVFILFILSNRIALNFTLSISNCLHSTITSKLLTPLTAVYLVNLLIDFKKICKLSYSL